MSLMTEQKTISIENNQNLLEEAVKAGVIYGHKRDKSHPRMKPYVVAERNEIQILDVNETLKSLNQAIEFLKSIREKNGVILLVGIKPSALEPIEKFSQFFNYPKVTKRWLGGFLTNFYVVKKRIDYFKDLKAQKERGEFEKYSKKEKLILERELLKLEEKFGGVLNLERLPDCVFIIDPSENKTAVKEARRMKIPIVAIVDNDDNPDLIDYPIIANDHAQTSIEWIVNKILEALKQISPTKEGQENEVKND